MPRRVRRRLEHEVLSVPGEEVCGVVLGRRGRDGARRVALARPVRNAAQDRRRAYVLAPDELVEAMRSARESGLELLGYYHSHPTGSAEPSASDREHAWPDVSYLILALDSGGGLLARSWRLAGTELAEEPIVWAAVG
ncbi:MAG: M67 family metallopeptidase [Thermoanaerobaculia bacterium]